MDRFADIQLYRLGPSEREFLEIWDNANGVFLWNDVLRQLAGRRIEVERAFGIHVHQAHEQGDERPRKRHISQYANCVAGSIRDHADRLMTHAFYDSAQASPGRADDAVRFPVVASARGLSGCR